jgi:WG containing repeat
MYRFTATFCLGLALSFLLFLTGACEQMDAKNSVQPSSDPSAATPAISQSSSPEVGASVDDSENKNLRYGFINHRGEFVISPKFKSASCFRAGLTTVSTEKGFALINKASKFITQPGEYLPRHPYSCDDWPNYAEGLYLVQQDIKVSNLSQKEKEADLKPILYGYVNDKGKVIIPLKPHLSAQPFADGMARFTDQTDQSSPDEIKVAEQENKKTGYGSVGIRQGYMDTTGKIVIPPKFTEGEDFRWGIAKVSIERYETDPDYPGQKKAVRYYGLIDKQGRYLIEPTLKDSQFTCVEGKLLIKNSQSLMGKDAFTMNSPAIKELCADPNADKFQDGFANLDLNLPPSADVDQLLKNQAGKQLFPGKLSSSNTSGAYYQRVRDGIGEGLAVIERDDGYKCFIDNQGKFVIPCKYKDADPFTEGLAAVAIEIDPKQK